MIRHLKVLFVSNLFPDSREPYRGLDNATLLHHLAPRCHVRVVSPRPGFPPRFQPPSPRDADRQFSPVYVRTSYVPRFGCRWNHRLMARALRPSLQTLRPEFDVVLCSWLFPDAAAVSLLARELKFPFVAIAQGSDVHQYLQMPSRRRAILQALSGGQSVITRSRELGRLLEGAGVSNHQIHPIYNGVDLETFRPGDSAAARRELGLPGQGKVILFVGNLLPIKDPLLLLQTHAELCRTRPDTTLVIVGGGKLESQIRKLAGPMVRLAGRLSAPQIARYLQAADVLCLSSRNEGVPNVILEALATGLPVVSTDVGGISEIISRDFLGRLVPAGNATALAAALHETLDAGVDRARIRLFAEYFAWSKTVDRYLELLARAARIQNAE